MKDRFIKITSSKRTDGRTLQQSATVLAESMPPRTADNSRRKVESPRQPEIIRTKSTNPMPAPPHSSFSQRIPSRRPSSTKPESKRKEPRRSNATTDRTEIKFRRDHQNYAKVTDVWLGDDKQNRQSKSIRLIEDVLKCCTDSCDTLIGGFAGFYACFDCLAMMCVECHRKPTDCPRRCPHDSFISRGDIEKFREELDDPHSIIENHIKKHKSGLQEIYLNASDPKLREEIEWYDILFAMALTTLLVSEVYEAHLLPLKVEVGGHLGTVVAVNQIQFSHLKWSLQFDPEIVEGLDDIQVSREMVVNKLKKSVPKNMSTLNYDITGNSEYIPPLIQLNLESLQKSRNEIIVKNHMHRLRQYPQSNSLAASLNPASEDY